MKIAIFSDVHGNLTALEAVLDDIERQAADLVVFAGDLCLMGPRPAACLRLVRERRLPAVVGNTDLWLVGQNAPPEQHAAYLEWTREQFAAGDLEWLGRLPFALRVSPTAAAAGDLLIVHANPFDVNAVLYPPEEAQVARYGEVRQSDAEVERMLAGVEAAVLAFGHLHIPNVRPLQRVTLVNVSSVSMPGDGDGRAKYALLSWGDGRWSVERHRVVYDATAEAEAFRQRRPPNWERAVAGLEQDGYYYPQKI